jgi:Tat protein translocase TatB subunit
MFNVGPAEVLVILVVALLVLGPAKLPEAARQVGKAMSELRRMASGLEDEVRGVLDEHFDAAPPPVYEPPAEAPSELPSELPSEPLVEPPVEPPAPAI